MIDQSNLLQLRTELEKMGKDLDFIKGVELEFNRAVEKRALLEKTAEEEYLSHLRAELSKMAGSQLSEEKILEITESKESFTKAARLEAEQVWEGMKEELMKMGCDEDYISGMLKEAATFGGGWRLLRAIPNAIREHGFSNTFSDLASAISKPLNRISHAESGALRIAGNAANVPLSDSGKFLHMPGAVYDPNSISHAFLEKVQARNAATPVVSGAAGGARNNLNILHEEAIQDTVRKLKDYHGPFAENQFNQIVEQAGKGDEAARKAISSFAGDKDEQLGSAIGYGGAATMHTPAYNKSSLKAFADIQNSRGANAHPIYPEHSMVEGFRDKAKEVVNAKYDPSKYTAPIQDASRVAQTGVHQNTNLFRVTPGRGLGRAAKFGVGGSLLGSMFGLPGLVAGGLGGAALGGLTGTLGTGGALAAGALGSGYLGYKGLQATGLVGQNNQLDATGLPQDRNRLVPTFNNKFAGGVGGALLAALIAQETGMGGAAPWLLPILGGIAGYNYFPQMMNKWKDPYGTGANYMGPAATAHMQQMMGQQ